MKIIIFGSNGMLGHCLYTELSKKHEVIGTVREGRWHPLILEGYGINEQEKIDKLIAREKPDFVINCIGVIKQLKLSKDKLHSIEVNSLWPHKLAQVCKVNSVKMIHFSTDCVFTGDKGNYTEDSLADSRDTYGLSKFMGEVDYDHTLTLRTSIIGHELRAGISLVDWFLSQKDQCKGFQKAIYSGFPTIVIAKILDEVIFNNFKSGIYHLSSEPINKYDLLKLVAKEYGKKINIIPSDELVIDRSLNSHRFRKDFNFSPMSWPDMIKLMHNQYKESPLYIKDNQ